MAIKITPLGEVMGAEVSGLEPQPGLSARLNAALQEHIVLCIRGEVLEPLDFLELARGFGTPQLQLIRRFRHPDVPEVTILSSNLDSEGKARAKGEKPAYQATYWHTDDSYKAVPCAKTMLHALEVPGQGGNTHFCNSYAVYDALPAGLRQQIEGRSARHCYRSRRGASTVTKRSDEERSETPDVLHPLVRTHPETGRKALYINPNRIESIVGLEAGESDALLDELYAIAFEERFHYQHKWRTGDIVIWDNRCSMHAGPKDYTEPRVMHRILIEGTVPV